MVSVLASSVVDRWIESRSSQTKKYLLLLCYARSNKEKEQILVGSESESFVRLGRYVYPRTVVSVS